MANKQAIYTFGGINQDTTKSKHAPEYYFEGQHIKILATDEQSTGSVTNEVGNTVTLSLPTITINESLSTITYGSNTLVYSNSNELSSQIASTALPISSNSQTIIGHIETREGIALWSTDDLGFDCIWYVPNILDGSYSLQLLYVRSFGFSTNNPIQPIFNYENENIQKVYWIDGFHQIRYINLTHNQIEGNTPLIDVPLNTINFVGNILFSQPLVTDVIAGGNHTAGMVQYAYNLYRLNGSQTKLSPLSELITLDKGDNQGGGELNEVVSSTPVINISNIDTAYTNIKVYAIKYTSLNQIPSVNLIDERELTGNSITVYDDGSTIESISLDELIFLGSNPLIPKHIESKDSRLFLSNIQDVAFDLPEELDMRAYSFPISSASTRVWENPQTNTNGTLNISQNWTPIPSDWNFNLKHPSINLEYRTRKYQKSSTIKGGEGKFIKYELVQKTSAQLAKSPDEYRFLKDDELYRIGIQFYNNLGQISPPKWIADFRAPEGNLEGNYNTLKVTLTSAFYTWLNTYTFGSDADTPVGYKIIRADRTAGDRTIMCQGALTQYMVQTDLEVGEWEAWSGSITKRKNESNNRTKFPIPVSRGFISNINPLNKTKHLEMMNENSDYGTDTGKFPNEEIFSGTERSWKRQQSWQFTKLMQMHSPEVQFNVSLSYSSSLKLRIKGLAQNTKNDIWLKRVNAVNEVVQAQWIEQNVSSFLNNLDIRFHALFGPSAESAEMDFQLINREYTTYVKNTNTSNAQFEILGRPEVTERGQGETAYNNRGELKYSNSLEGFLTDRGDDDARYAAIVSMNGWGNKCLTIAEGSSEATIDGRKGLEDIKTFTTLASSDGLLLAELVLPDAIVATGNIYGGNSYEDRSRTSYIEIGSYEQIATTNVQIDNAGDTYVYDYTFLRISKTETQVLDDQVLQLTERVVIPIETTVDLKNRNDQSNSDWNASFQPSYDVFHKYNPVYSQSPNLVSNNSVDFNFRRIKGFDTRIQTTKLKIPNENVDNWTDVLENELLDLDGKYGAINNIVVYKDTMYSFQDNAIAAISINPRIQIQGNDGVGLELGTGGILYDFTYLTTTSGSINKWGIVAAKKGIYYYDALNKAIGRIPDAVTVFLTDAKGLHSYFNNNYNYNLLNVDNPLKGKGVVFGYDNYNNDVYFTLLQDAKSFTRCYNELREEFVDLKTYLPSRYINKGDKLLLPNSSNTQLWESYSGETNNFFGVNQPSYIILQLNPESHITAIFDNIFFNSEISINDIDQPEKTLTHIQAYNEFQDSGRIPLIVGRDSNLRRKFRNWRANIPRDGRERIRNPWIYLKLELDQSTNQKLILHDIILNYTV